MKRLLLSGVLALMIHALLFSWEAMEPPSPMATGNGEPGAVIIDLAAMAPVEEHNEEIPEEEPTPPEPPAIEEPVADPEPEIPPVVEEKPAEVPAVPEKPAPPKEKKKKQVPPKPKKARKKPTPKPKPVKSASSGPDTAKAKPADLKSGKPDAPRNAKAGESSGPIEMASPMYKKNRPPPYPRLSRKRGEQGRVLLKVLVDASGRVGDIKVARSSGYPNLDTAALKAVRNWRFVPGKRAGIPISTWVEVPIAFSLK